MAEFSVIQWFRPSMLPRPGVFLMCRVLVVVLVFGRSCVVSTASQPVYNTFLSVNLQSEIINFTKSAPCECRMMCFTAQGCTAVSITNDSAGVLRCHLTNTRNPYLLLTNDDQAITLVTDTLQQPEPGEFHLDAACKISQWTIGALRPYEDTHASNISILTLTDGDCLYLEEIPQNWTTARETCMLMGGDLYVAGDFTGLQNYLAETSFAGVWVGARNQTWLDGHQVRSDGRQYIGEEDGTMSECIAMYKGTFQHGMMYLSCGDKYPFLCQEGVTYPNVV